MSNTRTAYVAKNMAYATVCQVINIILGFVARTIFIKTLGVEYLGVNGLFTNILTILSLAELGIGNAIVYSLYKPLAENDKEKIKSLMVLYKKAYRIIGLVVAAGGLLVIPFLHLLIREAPQINENLTLIYLLFLTNSVVSYYFIYNSLLITADQKNYIVTIFRQVFYILQVALQVLFLLLTHNFIIYLVILIVCTFLNNITIYRKAIRLFPYIQHEKPMRLAKEERSEVFSNVKALLFYKIGSVALNGTDNIIISAFIGIAAVGITSNYLLIFSTLIMIVSQVTGAFTASIGNINAVERTEKKESIFNILLLITMWLYGFCAAGLMSFSSNFVHLWLGATFTLDTLVVFSLVLHFYINQVHFAAYTYRMTMGLFVPARFAPILAAVINVILSILFARIWGLAGVFFATAIARFITTGIVDPILIYKRGFAKNPLIYYKLYFIYTAVVVCNYLIANYLIGFITMTGWGGFLVKLLVFSVVFNGVQFCVFFHTTTFKNMLHILKGFLHKRFKSCSPKETGLDL